MPAPPIQSLAAPLEPPIPTPSADIYGEVTGEPFPIPAVQLTGLDPTYLRTTVRYPGTEEPGTIVVDPPRRYLYLVQAGGSALRFCLSWMVAVPAQPNPSRPTPTTRKRAASRNHGHALLGPS